MFVKLLSLVLIAATSFAAPLVEEFKTRQNDCKDVTVFFARGTFEPGTLGLLVGPELQNDLQRDLAPTGKSLTFTGIEYPADIFGISSAGGIQGVQNMLNSVRSTANSCPDTKIVASGYRQACFLYILFFIDVVLNYSQGAQVVHLALAQLSPEEQNRVAAVVTFGDPYRDRVLPGDLQSRRDTFCAKGDTICDGDQNIHPPHLLYGETVSELLRHSTDNSESLTAFFCQAAPAAAEFIVKMVS